MGVKMRYTIYDEERGYWLCSFRRPVKGCDAAVTQWTRHPEKAMRFPGAKSARGVARWIDGATVKNARGEAV